MTRIHLLSGWLFIIAIFMAGCESINTLPGKVNGIYPGQTVSAAGNQRPGQPGQAANNPDIMTNVNPSPQPPGLPQATLTLQGPQATLTPQAPLTHSTPSGAGGNVADWPVYQDTLYHFKISYPAQYEFQLLDNAELAKLTPAPITGTYFNDPAVNLGGIVLPRFSIRIFKIVAGASVEDWLKSHGLYLPDSGWTIQKYQGEHFSGYQVNSSTYMAPGVFFYTTQGDYLYQLTPLGQEGETMLTTFEFTP